MIQLFINEYVKPGDIILSTRGDLYIKYIPCTVIVQGLIDDELPFEDETFDIVIADEKVFKNEVDRVLKKSGKSFFQK
jgi:hypothetical protein